MSARVVTRSCLVTALACVALSAQEERRPTFLRVLDLAGEPVAGAEVSLVGSLPHLTPALQDLEALTFESDRRGRVIARLRPGLCYVAWARMSVPGEPASLRVSPPCGYLAAGSMVDLVLSQVGATRRVQLQGLEAWRHRGPLRCFAMTPSPGMEEELAIGRDGFVTAPGAPYDAIELRLPDGQPLWRARPGAALVVPPPRRIRTLVVDEAGAPIAGAVLKHRVDHAEGWALDGLRALREDRIRRLGSSDADGGCVVEVPYPDGALSATVGNLLLLAAAPGRVEVATGQWGMDAYESDHRVGRLDGELLRFECARAEPLSGLVPGAPAGTVVQFAAICKLHLQRNSYQHDPRVFTATIGSDARFELLDVPGELHSCMVSFVPPRGSDWLPPLFPPEKGRQLPHCILARERRSLPLGDVRLDVRDGRGDPVRGGIALISSADRRGVLLRDSLRRVPLDERGGADLRLSSGAWVVVVLRHDGYGAASVTVDEGRTQLRMDLEPLARVTVKLVDRAARPVAGARLLSRGSRVRGTSDPIGSILQGLQHNSLVAVDRLRTDDQGTVVVPFVPVAGVQQRFVLEWDGRCSEEFGLVPFEDVSVSEQLADDAPKRPRRW